MSVASRSGRWHGSVHAISTLMLVLTACRLGTRTSSSRREEPPGQAQPAPLLTARILNIVLEQPKGARLLGHTEVLQEGWRFRVGVSLSTQPKTRLRAFLYVVHQHGNQTRLMWDSQGAVEGTKAGHSIPNDGTWLRRDSEQPGDQICVLASLTALPSSRQRCTDSRRPIPDPPTPQPSPPRQPPGPKRDKPSDDSKPPDDDKKLREFRPGPLAEQLLAGEQTSAAFDAGSQAPGFSIIQLPLRHEPKPASWPEPGKPTAQLASTSSKLKDERPFGPPPDPLSTCLKGGLCTDCSPVLLSEQDPARRELIRPQVLRYLALSCSDDGKRSIFLQRQAEGPTQDWPGVQYEAYRDLQALYDSSQGGYSKESIALLRLALAGRNPHEQSPREIAISLKLARALSDRLRQTLIPSDADAATWQRVLRETLEYLVAGSAALERFDDMLRYRGALRALTGSGSTGGPPDADWQPMPGALSGELPGGWLSAEPLSPECLIVQESCEQQLMTGFNHAAQEAALRPSALVALGTGLFGQYMLLENFTRAGELVARLEKELARVSEPSVRVQILLMQGLWAYHKRKQWGLDPLARVLAELGTLSGRVGSGELRASIKYLYALQARENARWRQMVDNLSDRPRPLKWVELSVPENPIPALFKLEGLLAQDKIPEAAALIETLPAQVYADLAEILGPGQTGTFRSAVQRLEEVVFGAARNHPELHTAAMRLAVSYRGSVMEQERRLLLYLAALQRSGTQPKLIEMIESWKKDLARIARLTWGAERDEQRRETLLLKAQREHRQLLGLYGPDRSAQSGSGAMRAIPLQYLAAELPVQSALLEIVRAKPIRTGASRIEDLYGLPRFLGLLLTRRGEVKAYDLDLFEEVETHAKSFLLKLTTLDANQIPIMDPRDEARWLYDHLLSGVYRDFPELRRIYLVPEGSLQIIPFAALYDGRRYLVQTKEFVNMVSGRDLLRPGANSSDAKGVAVFAYPAMKRELSPVAAQLDPALSAQDLFIEGPRQEAKAIKELIPNAIVYEEDAATEQALRLIRRPAILHIGTHGLFQHEQRSPIASPANLTKGGPINKEGPLLGSQAEGPLLGPQLAGAPLLLLATPSEPLSDPGEDPGSPLVPTSGIQNEQDPSHDGIVSAGEVQSLDLNGTQLVVLSACYVGSGPVTIGEGVNGLRRALFLAGAESTVTSLWAINDRTTTELMSSYYRHLLSPSAPSQKIVALYQAMRELMDRAPLYQHPYYWAPFIHAGNDGYLVIPSAQVPLKTTRPVPSHTAGAQH